MEIDARLFSLLAASKQHVLVCQLLNQLSDGLGFDATGPVAIREVRQIFRQRARHNESIGSPIEGFPDLVNGLEAFTAEAVVIYMIYFDEGDYGVFANAGQTELAGVLKFPKTTAAQKAARVSSRLQHEALLASSRLQTA